MDQTPLVNDMIDAGAQFLKEFEKRYPIAAAFWMKDRDESRWNLHVASQGICETDRGNAYSEVIRIAKDMKDYYFDPLNVKLRRMDAPIVKFVMDFQSRHPGRIATVFNVPTFEGVEVEGMYLYPPVRTAAA